MRGVGSTVDTAHSGLSVIISVGISWADNEDGPRRGDNVKEGKVSRREDVGLIL